MTHGEDPGDTPVDTCEVGYGRPPRVHQFKKGRSGNPRGRPRVAKTYEAMVWEELAKPVRVSADGKTRSVSTAQALLMRTLREGLGGKRWAVDQALRLIDRYGVTEEAASPDWNFEALTDEEFEVFDGLLLKISSQERDTREN